MDLETSGLSGLQIINGALDDGFRKGYRAWVHQLLSGKRLYAIAGNDAHGNFNRFRQIGIPFLMIRETHHQIFGRMRTGLFIAEDLNERAIVNALSNGLAIMTDGPIARLTPPESELSLLALRKSMNGDSFDFDVETFSSPEFGEINAIHVIVGSVGDSSERTAFRFEGKQGYAPRKRITLKQSAASYVRIEVWTSEENLFDQQRHYCFTNPVWQSPSS